MTIEPEVLTFFKLKSSHGDIAHIRALSFKRAEKDPAIKPVSRNTISNALRTGRMNESTYEHLKAYYDEKTSPIKRIHEEDGN